MTRKLSLYRIRTQIGAVSRVIGIATSWLMALVSGAWAFFLGTIAVDPATSQDSGPVLPLLFAALLLGMAGAFGLAGWLLLRRRVPTDAELILLIAVTAAHWLAWPIVGGTYSPVAMMLLALVATAAVKLRERIG